MPHQDPVVGVSLDDHAAAPHVRDQGPGGGHDELLQPVQEHRALAQEEDPAVCACERDSTE